MHWVVYYRNGKSSSREIAIVYKERNFILTGGAARFILKLQTK